MQLCKDYLSDMLLCFRLEMSKKYSVRYSEFDCYEKKTIKDLKYEGSNPKRGLLWIRDYVYLSEF